MLRARLVFQILVQPFGQILDINGQTDRQASNRENICRYSGKRLYQYNEDDFLYFIWANKHGNQEKLLIKVILVV